MNGSLRRLTVETPRLTPVFSLPVWLSPKVSKALNLFLTLKWTSVT